MESTYTTRKGDVWDAVAYRVYGDVKYTGWLMQNNFPYLDIFVFDSGTVLRTPEPPSDDSSADLPLWRTTE